MTYRATEDISLAPGFLAYKKGQAVPESAIANLGIEDKVAAERTEPVRPAARQTAPVVRQEAAEA